MPSPYEPKGWPRDSAPERRSPLDQYLARLSDLGATQDELDGVADTWDDPVAFPPDWKQQLLLMGDHELTAMLAEVREEHRLGTTDPAADQEAATHAAYRSAWTDASERIGGNVTSILAWVGEDLVRAQAVHQLETGPDGANRSTLVQPLQDMLATGAVEPAAGPQAVSGPNTPEDPPAADSGAQGGHSEAAG